MTLSVVITAYNNDQLIKECIKSVKFADEIIVVDNGSTDDTVKVATKAGATIYTHPNNPNNLNVAKNFGFSKAKSDWILSLDPDEQVESDLQQQIHNILQSTSNTTSGYLMPRKNIIFGKWIKHGLWYPDHVVRLFQKGLGGFPCIHNHELLAVKGKTEMLTGHILHYNYQSVSQYLQKIDKQYSQNEADVFVQQGKKINWSDALKFPFQDFLTNYFARQGYKDGLHGLVLAMLQSIYMFVVFCKIWEGQGFPETKINLNQVKNESKGFNKQLKYWFIKSTTQKANPIKKLLLKITSKLS